MRLSAKLRRGNTPLDNVFALIILMFFAILIVTIGLVMGRFNTAFQATSAPDDAKNVIDKAYGNGYSSLWDNLFLFMLVGITLSLFFGALFLDNNPVFFWIGIITYLVFLFIATIFNNVFINFVGGMSGEGARYPIMSYIFGNLLTISIFMGGIVMLGLFAKSKSAGGS